MLSHNLMSLHAMFDLHRKTDMRLSPEVVKHVCHSLAAMAGDARALEARCVPAGARLVDDLPGNVVRLDTVAMRHNARGPRDAPGGPGPGNAP